MKNQLARYRVGIVVSVGAMVALFLMLKGSSEPLHPLFNESPLITYALGQFEAGNTIIFNLSTGYLVSVFFWVLVVALPDHQRRSILRKNLLFHYASFKKQLAHTMLEAAGDVDAYRKSQQLTDFYQFREYFSENNREKWYVALKTGKGVSTLIKTICEEKV